MTAHPSAPITASTADAWLRHLDYPQPRPGLPVLIYVEGAHVDFGGAEGGRLWPSPGGDVWEGTADGGALPLHAVENRVDEFNDAGILSWVGDDGAPHIGVFQGSVNPGSVLSGRSGWPQLGDGAHLYGRSARYDNGKDCFRSNRNRVLREQPTAAGAGGDLVLTLSEVIARGMAVNGSILIHPGRRATWSAGCPLTPGGYEDASWKMLWGHSHPGRHGGLWVIRHKGADALSWLAAGSPAERPPLLRPGCNSGRWVAPMQRALDVGADGYFGPATAKALLSARLRSGMDPARADVGEVSPQEWRTLTAQRAA